MTAPPKSLPLILSELRIATTQQHQLLDKRIPFYTADQSLYTRLIEAYYGFYRPLENLLFQLAMTIPDLNWLIRSKTPSLEADLNALGLDVDEIVAIPLCRFSLKITTVADVLACCMSWRAQPWADNPYATGCTRAWGLMNTEVGGFSRCMARRP